MLAFQLLLFLRQLLVELVNGLAHVLRHESIDVLLFKKSSFTSFVAWQPPLRHPLPYRGNRRAS